MAAARFGTLGAWSRAPHSVLVVESAKVGDGARAVAREDRRVRTETVEDRVEPLCDLHASGGILPLAD